MVILLLLLWFGAWVACQIEVPGHAETSVVELDRWVRTIDGWQHTSDWAVSKPVYFPRLHPLLVALGQGLLSLLALLAFPVGSWYRTGKNPGN